MKIPEYAEHMTLVFAANIADRDPAEHMVFISRGEGEGRIERKIRKSQINTERLAAMFLCNKRQHDEESFLHDILILMLC